MADNNVLFREFLASSDTLRVYSNGSLKFKSGGSGILPLINYLDENSPCFEEVTVFDRKVGNAAALLLELAKCREVWSPLGSELAEKTLRANGIKFTFLKTLPYIVNRAGNGMCPFEKASIGKTAEEFYTYAREALKGKPV